MAEIPIEVVPVSGGYALHLVGCDCPERETVLPGAPWRRRYPVTSVTDAVARLYRDSNVGVGVTAPDRFVVRGCARNLPREDPTPMTWAERHQYYVNEAAQYTWTLASQAIRAAKGAADRMEETRNSADGTQLRIWFPHSGDIAEVLMNSFRANLFSICVDRVGVEPKDDETCTRVVNQTEKALRDALEALMENEIGRADPVNRLYADIEKRAAQAFARTARDILSRVYAHRAARDAVI
ncbi:hypothetical protein [Streptomyces sp. NPDC059278]|uniref:hypothetical protein n=1 Tax=Streptomyces sp. NPDC059278 TaxID=3346801 RepID=UPI00367410CC